MKKCDVFRDSKESPLRDLNHMGKFIYISQNKDTEFSIKIIFKFIFAVALL